MFGNKVALLPNILNFVKLINAKMDTETIIKIAFESKTKLKTAELVAILERENPGLPHSSILKLITSLVRSNTIFRVKKGEYTLSNKRPFNPFMGDQVGRIDGILKHNFPLVSYCLCESQWINGFAQHIALNNFLLVDVGKDVVESVANRLRDEYKGVFVNPTKEIIDSYLHEFELPIIVRNLITEAPIIRIDKIPIASIEKILVDIISDVEFFYLQGYESVHIFENAFNRCAVNSSVLLRYAARRGKKQEAKTFIKDE